MSVDLETVQRVLHDHIVQEILLRKAPLAAEEDLFDAGFDSLSLSRMLVFVEEHFGVLIPDEDVVVDDISTLARLARFVAGRIAAARR